MRRVRPAFARPFLCEALFDHTAAAGPGAQRRHEYRAGYGTLHLAPRTPWRCWRWMVRACEERNQWQSKRCSCPKNSMFFGQEQGTTRYLPCGVSFSAIVAVAIPARRFSPAGMPTYPVVCRAPAVWRPLRPGAMSHGGVSMVSSQAPVDSPAPSARRMPPTAATGKLGIAIIGRGPATANAMHRAVNANRAGSRVLLVFSYASTGSAAPSGLDPDGKTFNASPRTVFPATTSSPGRRCACPPAPTR